MPLRRLSEGPAVSVGDERPSPGRRKRRGDRHPPTIDPGEWVGGQLAAPAYVTAGKLYRVEVILWLELPDDVVVGTEDNSTRRRFDSGGWRLRFARSSAPLQLSSSIPTVRADPFDPCVALSDV